MILERLGWGDDESSQSSDSRPAFFKEIDMYSVVGGKGTLAQPYAYADLDTYGKVMDIILGDIDSSRFITPPQLGEVMYVVHNSVGIGIDFANGTFIPCSFTEEGLKVPENEDQLDEYYEAIIDNYAQLVRYFEEKGYFLTRV